MASSKPIPAEGVFYLSMSGSKSPTSSGLEVYGPEWQRIMIFSSLRTRTKKCNWHIHTEHAYNQHAASRAGKVLLDLLGCGPVLPLAPPGTLMELNVSSVCQWASRMISGLLVDK